jgi:STE24 endopeptidase
LEPTVRNALHSIGRPAATEDRRLLPLNAGFTLADLDRARRYRRPLYLAALVGLGLDLAFLALAAFGPLGDALFAPLDGLPWWGAALAYPALLVSLLFVLHLPLAFWRDYLRERRFGLSTQTFGGWLDDQARGLAIELVLAAAVLGGLVGLAHALPRAWPAVAAPAAAGVVLVLTFLAPVVLEPVFNRFTPLGDADLAERLRRLSDRAGVPVRDVLVADASKRTTKQNAYVSGLGRTRRVVLFDTLLREADRRRIELVVAHELGHRRDRHVAKLTALAMVGVPAAVLGLWGLLQWDALLSATGADGASDPRIVPFVLLAGLALEWVALPGLAALSRRFERDADRASLELTRDVEAFVESHRELARSNVSDLDPPRAVYVAMFTHPTPPERIAAARVWSATAG